MPCTLLNCCAAAAGIGLYYLEAKMTLAHLARSYTLELVTNPRTVPYTVLPQYKPSNTGSCFVRVRPRSSAAA